MNKLFKDGILDVNINVNGETDDYVVTIKFGGFLEELSKAVKTYDTFNLRVVTKALIAAFNREDVYIHCSCPDFYYRFSYWATKNDITSGTAQNIPSPITNPFDDKGPGCKHIMLILSNNSWLVKVSSVIHNYVNYMEKYYQKLYADIIYPAIYQQEYQEPVQLDLDSDDDNMKTDSDTLDVSNRWARTKTQFQKGNQSGVQFTGKTDPKQFDFDSLISDNS